MVGVRGVDPAGVALELLWKVLTLAGQSELFGPHPKPSILDLTVELKNHYVLGFIICEMVTVIALQDWVGREYLP